MTSPSRFEFPIAKAQYLFNRATEAGVGGDKRKFWQEVMGFESPTAIREVILADVSLDMLQLRVRTNTVNFIEPIYSLQVLLGYLDASELFGLFYLMKMLPDL